MTTEEIERCLQPLRDDYTSEFGKPFRHFYCPLLFRDEDVELCMGHIVPHCVPNCCRAKVVQRGDIDHWYGSLSEAEFGTLMEVRAKGLKGVVFEEELRKKVRPTITVDGKECVYYPHREGKTPSNHARIELTPEGGGAVVRLALVKTPAEMMEDQHKKWSMGFVHDWRLPVLVTVIKSAYLTLFRLLGYKFATSPAGLEIGRYTLGKFFEDNQGKPMAEVRKAAADFFRPYRHIVRPVQEVGGNASRGTIEDYRVAVAFGTSGRPFALLVWVRMDRDLYAVLMPGFSDADSMDAYRSFREADEDRWLRVYEGVSHADRRCWEVFDHEVPVFWPKQGGSFDI